MMNSEEIITQPIDDPIGSMSNIDGKCYIKTNVDSGGINKVLIADSGVVISKSSQLTNCSRNINDSSVTSPDRVSVDNVNSVKTTPCEFGDYRCLDIIDNSCHYGICDCNKGGESTIELIKPLPGLSYFSVTYQTSTTGFKHVSIKANDVWYDVISSDTPAQNTTETHWIDFINGVRYQGENQQTHTYPSVIPNKNFWSMADIQAFRFKLINTEIVSLPLLRLYNTVLRRGDKRVPLLSKPIDIQYTEL